MRTRLLLSGVLVIVSASGLFAACGDPGTRTPTTDSLPHPAFVTIIGPASIPPGTTAQLAAQVQQSDGTTKTALSPTVRWTSSNPSVLTVNANGLATASSLRGDAVVTAEVNASATRRSSLREIVVVPDGTFRVVGLVTDSNVPPTPIPGARVEVVGTTVVATTGSNGEYRLYGVPPDAAIEASAAGYQPRSQTVHLTGHTTVNHELTFAGPLGGLTGNYTLAFDVLDTCPGQPNLSQDNRHRTYDAVMTQTGAALEVELTEPRFRLNGANRGNRFFGRVVPGGAIFTIDYYDYYYQTQYSNIAERLSDNTILVPSGTANAFGSGGGLTATLVFGSITRWGSGFPGFNSIYLGGCFGPIKFSLTPR